MTVYGINDPGPLVIATDVDNAVLAILKKWMPTYLRLLSLERNLGYQLATPKSYAPYGNVDEILDWPVPAILVTTASAGKTVGGANFIYQASWEVRVSAVVRGRNPQESKETASLFEGALRRCMLDKCRQNDGPLNNCHWDGSDIAPVANDTRNGRYLAAGMGTYHVFTDAAVRSFGGPDVPDADGYVSLATVDNVDISIENKTD